MGVASAAKVVENRTRWKGIVAKSPVYPNDFTRLWDKIMKKLALSPCC